MVRSLFRILIGYALASIAAGGVQTLFVLSPLEVLGSLERAGQAGLLTLMAGTQTATFAAPFAGIAIILSEWLARRDLATYAAFGLAIGATAFIAVSTGSDGDRLFHAYAGLAFLTAGFAGGLVYGLISGRWAGSWRRSHGL